MATRNYRKNIKTRKTRKNRKTLRRNKKGGLLTTSGFGIGNFMYSKTQGARQYNPKTGKWDYQAWTPGLDRMFAPTNPTKDWS